MRLATNRVLRIAAFGLALVACTSDRIVVPSPVQSPPISLGDLATQAEVGLLAAGPSERISEFHYNYPGPDSAGTEKVEISGAGPVKYDRVTCAVAPPNTAKAISGLQFV